MILGKLEAAIEAILFAVGDAVPLSELQKATGLEQAAVKAVIDRLASYYEDNDRGLKITEFDGKYQLCTNPSYSEYILELLKSPQKKSLTPTLLETLAIIAYKQPVTKSAIEEIRGVSAEHAVNKLVEYGLVIENGRLDAPGRPILFGTSDEFLRYFGLKNLGELPDTPKTTDGDQLSINDVNAEI